MVSFLVGFFFVWLVGQLLFFVLFVVLFLLCLWGFWWWWFGLVGVVVVVVFSPLSFDLLLEEIKGNLAEAFLPLFCNG